MVTLDLSLFTGLREVPTWMLQGSNNVTKLILPYSLTTLGQNVVYGQRTNIVIIVGDAVNGSRLNLLQYGSFGSARAVILYATTPPNRDSPNSNNNNFYVPDEVVDVYKTAWSNNASKIKPISEWKG